MGALSFPWMFITAYAFPSCPLVLKFLQRLLREPVFSVLPYWLKRPWFLLAMHFSEFSYQDSLFPSTSDTGQSSSSKPTEAGTSSMEFERRRFESPGCSQEVISILPRARKPTTNAMYARIWDKFLYATGKDFDPISPSTSNILGFLQTGLDLGLGLSSLRVQVAAISEATNTIQFSRFSGIC